MQENDEKNAANKGSQPNKPGQPTVPATNDKKGSHMPTDKTTEHQEKPDAANTKAENKEQPAGKRSK